MKTQSQIQQEIDRLQAELVKLQEHELFLKNNPTIALAERLHEALCGHNHTDGCDWYYRSWKDANWQYSKQEYYDKAAKLKNLLSEKNIAIDDLFNILNILHH